MSQFRVHPRDVREDEGRAVVRGDEAHHLTRVLRLGPGAGVALFDGAGRRWAGVVGRTGSEVEVVGLRPAPANEPPVRLELLAALPKGERWEWILEKGTELGVTAFRPVYTGRTVARLPRGRAERRVERWTRVVEAAVKQCERGRVPRVFPPEPLEGALQALGSPPSHEVRVVWAERRRRCPPLPGRAHRVILASGPEGGWDPVEVAALEAAGFVPAGLGPRILRAETAAVVGAALALARWGDLVGGEPR